MLSDDIYSIYKLTHKGGQTYRQMVGRFVKAGNHIKVLEDHGNLRTFVPQDTLTPQIEQSIARLAYNPTMELVGECQKGPNLNEVPKLHIPLDNDQSAPIEPEAAPQSPPPIFEFTLAEGKPHLVEFKGDQAFMDGNPLDPSNLAHILEKVKLGQGVLSYKKKMINPDLVKSVADSIQEVLAPAVTPFYPKEILYNDSLIEGLNNRYAYEKWAKDPKNGVFAIIDVNNLANLNRQCDPEQGNQAIQALGSILKDEFEAVQDDDSFMARLGGGTFLVYVKDPAVLASFARNVTKKLEEMPPVGGVHKLSLCIGIGNSKENAAQSLDRAKEQKYTSIVRTPQGNISKLESVHGFPPHNIPNFSHSSLFGAMDGETALGEDAIIDKYFGDEDWPEDEEE